MPSFVLCQNRRLYCFSGKGDRVGKTKRLRHECENVHSTAVSLSNNLFFDPRNISKSCKLVTKRSRRTWARRLKRGDYPLLSTTYVSWILIIPTTNVGSLPKANVQPVNIRAQLLAANCCFTPRHSQRSYPAKHVIKSQAEASFTV